MLLKIKENFKLCKRTPFYNIYSTLYKIEKVITIVRMSYFQVGLLSINISLIRDK